MAPNPKYSGSACRHWRAIAPVCHGIMAHEGIWRVVFQGVTLCGLLIHDKVAMRKDERQTSAEEWGRCVPSDLWPASYKDALINRTTSHKFLYSTGYLSRQCSLQPSTLSNQSSVIRRRTTSSSCCPFMGDWLDALSAIFPLVSPFLPWLALAVHAGLFQSCS